MPFIEIGKSVGSEFRSRVEKWVLELINLIYLTDFQVEISQAVVDMKITIWENFLIIISLIDPILASFQPYSLLPQCSC